MGLTLPAAGKRLDSIPPTSAVSRTEALAPIARSAIDSLAVKEGVVRIIVETSEVCSEM
jgi:hypothetical protein